MPIIIAKLNLLIFRSPNMVAPSRTTDLSTGATQKCDQFAALIDHGNLFVPKSISISKSKLRTVATLQGCFLRTS